MQHTTDFERVLCEISVIIVRKFKRVLKQRQLEVCKHDLMIRHEYWNGKKCHGCKTIGTMMCP